jgi:hypothetical protein
MNNEAGNFARSSNKTIRKSSEATQESGSERYLETTLNRLWSLSVVEVLQKLFSRNQDQQKLMIVRRRHLYVPMMGE